MALTTLISPDGVPFRTSNPSAITRLKYRGYRVEGEEQPTFVTSQFHPGDHGVDAVNEYIAEHPEDAERVIAEEKSGKSRKTIVGD